MGQKSYGIYNPDGIYFVTFTVVNWIDVFIRERYKMILVNSLKYCQEKKGLEIFAWCVMSSHIHLIIRAKEGYQLPAIIRDFKKYTASQLLRSIADKTQPESRREWLLWMFERSAKRNSRNTNHQLWQQNNHTEELFSPHFMEQKLNYIHQNPVLEGWVAQPAHYLYSSAINYEGKAGLLNVLFLE